MKPYEDLINAAADRAGVPRQVAQAMVDTENPRRDPTIVLQEAWGGGSYGLTMMTVTTARSLGFTGPAAQLKDPAINTALGFRYLRSMFDQVGKGSWSRAVAAYNAGPDLEPWPAQHVTRFESHLAIWRDRYGGFQQPPLLRAGVGAILGILILGYLLPMLFKRGTDQ